MTVSQTVFDADGFLADEALDARSVYRAEFARWFDFAGELNRFAVSLLKQVSLADVEESKFAVFLLTVRVIESFEAIVVLSERGMLSPARVIVRPILEALFTLVALSKDPALMRHYHDARRESSLRYLKRSCGWKDPNLKRIHKEQKYEKAYIKLKQEIKLNPLQCLSPNAWAEKADLSDIYDFHYTQYSSFIHSNLNALNEHLDHDGEGGVNAAFGPSTVGLDALLKDASSFLLCAVIALLDTFSIERDADFDQLRLQWLKVIEGGGE